MAKIGLKNIHYAIMDASHQDSATANPQYGTIKTPSCGAIQVDMQVSVSEAKLFADNKLWASSREFTEGSISLEIASLPAEMAADILGNNFDSQTGVLIKKSSDNPPFIALAGEFQTDDGGKLAFWLYKVKFSENNQTGQTKGETTSYQTNTLTGTFTALKGTGDNTDRWQYNKQFAANESTDSFYTAVPLAVVTP